MLHASFIILALHGFHMSWFLSNFHRSIFFVCKGVQKYFKEVLVDKYSTLCIVHQNMIFQYYQVNDT